MALHKEYILQIWVGGDVWRDVDGVLPFVSVSHLANYVAKNHISHLQEYRVITREMKIVETVV